MYALIKIDVNLYALGWESLNSWTSWRCWKGGVRPYSIFWFLISNIMKVKNSEEKRQRAQGESVME